MRSYDCPNCGATVVFQSSIAVAAVCQFCRSMVVRHDLNLENIGQVAELPPDLSPLQIGAHGIFNGEPFTLIGRIRVKWEEGSWTEWCALFSENRWGWVAEAQGFYMVSFEYAAPERSVTRDELKPGRSVKLAGQEFTVADVKETICLGSEGELPIVAVAGRKACSIDLTGDLRAFASLEFSEGGVRLYLGQYARFDDLTFSALRPVPGWSPDAIVDPKRNATAALACPNCGASVTLRAAGLSITAVCGSCGVLIDASDRELQIIQRAAREKSIEPVIPLGKRGILFGTEYEVIGYMVRSDPYASWSEYLLFNPWKGFRWLAMFQGHWNFINVLLEPPRVAMHGIAKPAEHAFHKGRLFRMFADVEATVKHVLGEFYWRVRVGEKAQAADFICPPYILTRESYSELREVTWSEGEYVEPAVIQSAFALEAPLPERDGVYLNQPNPYAERWATLRWVTPLLVAILFLIQMIAVSKPGSQHILGSEFVFRATDTNHVVVTEPFELKGGYQAVKLSGSAPVDNNWFEINIDLVDAVTKRKTSAEIGIEFYYGSEDGGWTEGRHTGEAIIPGVAPGKYYAVIEPMAGSGITELPYGVTLKSGVTVWSNFWIALAALVLYPSYVALRKHTFEGSRWSENDFSPYATTSHTSDVLDADE
jgi:hypothetical protein